MVINKPEHQQFLLELFKQVNFPGSILDLAYEVKQEILNAKVENANLSTLIEP